MMAKDKKIVTAAMMDAGMAVYDAVKDSFADWCMIEAVYTAMHDASGAQRGHNECIGTIEAGHERALGELVFLTSLLIKYGDRCPDLSGSLGFSDIFGHRCPQCGHGGHIRVLRASDEMLEHIAALREQVAELTAQRLANG